MLLRINRLWLKKELKDELREKHLLFQEPHSTLLLSSGMGRHWPDSPGIICEKMRIS